MIVLDASTVLALQFGEVGGEALLKEGPSCISSVNLAEVLGRLARDHPDVEIFLPPLHDAVGSVFPFTEAHALLSARLVPATRPYGLSFGDRACLALAQSLDAPVLTADRAWAKLSLPVEIRLIR
ncbi:type II toxin-antitoxin system VapC family toxin [Oceanibaculum pacificum]|uniref:PIN domain-containing protein n=1 Tax=Oceanibaculum pacificum TaxID=580166 RepID=A0A154WGL8_9PROT|nr:type II toxin-antitoxin system VapC family toxin [Oceanibaculum pacificum]KZD12668.1 hypothetical protein AUP43_15685 [Oceanibaculum pacificum]